MSDSRLTMLSPAALMARGADVFAATAGALLVVGFAVGAQSEAVANRFAAKVGIGGLHFGISDLVKTVLAPAGGAGQSEIMRLIKALIAVLILAAFAGALFGLLYVVTGRRGGMDKLGGAILGLIGGIAVLTVLA